MKKTAPKTDEIAARRRTPSRLAKSKLMERIKEDTKGINSGSMTTTLRKQGYEEIGLQELQDRLSKLRTPLAELILSTGERVTHAILLF